MPGSPTRIWIRTLAVEMIFAPLYYRLLTGWGEITPEYLVGAPVCHKHYKFTSRAHES